MDKNLIFADIPINYLRQEEAVIKVILTKLAYSGNSSNVESRLIDFVNGDYFGMGGQTDLTRITEIFNHYENLGILLNKQYHDPDNARTVITVKINTIKLKDYYSQLENEINKREPSNIKRWADYDPRTKTMKITQNNGQIVALTFRKSQSEQISGQALLFEVGYELWEANIPDFDRSEVLRRCEEKIKKYSVGIEASGEWLKNTRINLRRTIENSALKNLVRAFDMENPRLGKYRFSIEKPIT